MPEYAGNAAVREAVDPVLAQILALPESGSDRQVGRLLECLQQKLQVALSQPAVPGPPDVMSAATFAEAKTIMGDGHFFGPNAIEKAFPDFEFAFDLGMPPPLPSPERMRYHAALGHSLRLRVSDGPMSTKFTMQTMVQMLQETFRKNDDGPIFFGNTLQKMSRYWNFFTDKTPRPGWAFTSDAILPSTAGKDFLEQTVVLKSYLDDAIRLPGVQVSEEERAACQERSFDAIEPMTQLIETDPFGTICRLNDLKINQLLRPTAVEMLFDMLVTFLNSDPDNRCRLLKTTITSTITLDSQPGFIAIGYFDQNGAHLTGEHPSESKLDMGSVLSWRCG